VNKGVRRTSVRRRLETATPSTHQGPLTSDDVVSEGDLHHTYMADGEGRARPGGLIPGLQTIEWHGSSSDRARAVNRSATDSIAFCCDGYSWSRPTTSGRTLTPLGRCLCPPSVVTTSLHPLDGRSSQPDPGRFYYDLEMARPSMITGLPLEITSSMTVEVSVSAENQRSTDCPCLVVGASRETIDWFMPFQLKRSKPHVGHFVATRASRFATTPVRFSQAPWVVVW